MTWVLVPLPRRPDVRDEVRAEQRAARPVELRRPAAGDVLGHGVELRRDVALLLRPVGREDVVRATPEEQRVHGRDAGADLAADDVVEQRRLPAAEREAVRRVLLRTARRLRDAVESHEQIDVQAAHGPSSAGPRPGPFEPNRAARSRIRAPGLGGGLTSTVGSTIIDSMDTEWHAEIERRAELHAVLSDPGRLSVVELLALGDRSPSELSAELGMASNLVAHHVGVLADHGLVSRHRSEGDRRRTYLHLDADAAVVPRAGRFLARTGCCSCAPRTQHARTSRWRCGAGPAGSPPRRQAPTPGRRSPPAPWRSPPGTTCRSGRRARLWGDVRRDGDLVVTVCDNAHEEMGTEADLHWSVPDPVPRSRRRRVRRRVRRHRATGRGSRPALA